MIYSSFCFVYVLSRTKEEQHYISSMATDLEYFMYYVEQMETSVPRVLEMANNMDTIIRFRLSKVIGMSWIEAPIPVVYDDPKFESDIEILVLLSDVKRLSERRKYTKIVAEKLSSFGMAEDKLASIIENFFQVVEVAVPGVPIDVCISHVMIHFLDSESDAGLGDVTLRLWAGSKCMDNQLIVDRVTRFRPIPATRSSIEALKKLRLDNLEATVRETPCAICKDGLDLHFGAGEDEPMIARLPCSHVFHEDCITPWLEIHHLCPLCRYPMPIMEVGEPSMVSGRRRLHWPRLMVSAAGMITATLLCRLLKRT